MDKKKRKSFLLGLIAIMASLYVIALVVIDLTSASPTSAVKMRILEDLHPVIALKAKPYYDKDESKYLHKNVYSISESYLSPDASYTVTMFNVKKQHHRYIAHGQPDVLM